MNFPEAATEGVQWKKVFLKILQNSPESTCIEVSFLVKVQVEACKMSATLLKKDSNTGVFLRVL